MDIWLAEVFSTSTALQYEAMKLMFERVLDSYDLRYTGSSSYENLTHNNCSCALVFGFGSVFFSGLLMFVRQVSGLSEA